MCWICGDQANVEARYEFAASFEGILEGGTRLGFGGYFSVK